MITSRPPSDWRDLQTQVARILDECGFEVEIEKTVELVRGAAEIDVYAEETVRGRKYVILTECKHWQANVPQAVIHAFRTVVADSGANIGYIVSSSGFQSGAFTAADLTNVRLYTWEQFQTEFEETWIDNFLLQHVVDRIDPLFSYIEPILPAWFGDLTEAEQREFFDLKDQYDEFGWLMMQFTTYHRHTRLALPELPLRERVPPKVTESPGMPAEVLDATSYREFLDAALPYAENVLAEFRRMKERANT